MAEQKSSQQLAVEKLQGELKKAKNKTFAEPIIEHLISRCQEDAGFAEDVLGEKKTYENCDAYIYSMAKKEAGNSRQVAIRNDTVFEWAEDYYRMEKPWEPSKGNAQKATPSKASKAKSEKKNPTKITKSVSDAKTETNSVSEAGDTTKAETNTVDKGKSEPAEEKAATKKKEKKAEPKKKQNDISGQLSLFDLM